MPQPADSGLSRPVYAKSEIERWKQRCAANNKRRIRTCPTEKPWVVIAGGPSLTLEDVEACKGRAYVCVVNNAHELAPWAHALYAADHQWWRTYHKRTLHFEGEKFSQADCKTLREMGDITHVQGRNVNARRGSGGLAETLPIINGRNSGHAAINLVHVLFGAQTIGLLGFDMQRTFGRSHWHGDHVGTLAAGVPQAGNFGRWIEAFRNLADDAKGRCHIVNCSRETALKCFPRMSIEDFLRRWA